ncbi:hypothetical protein Tco_1393677 [Tanacetum coccineum]
MPVINNVDELNEDECFDPGGGEINVEGNNTVLHDNTALHNYTVLHDNIVLHDNNVASNFVLTVVGMSMMTFMVLYVTDESVNFVSENQKFRSCLKDLMWNRLKNLLVQGKHVRDFLTNEALQPVLKQLMGPKGANTNNRPKIREVVESLARIVMPSVEWETSSGRSIQVISGVFDEH